MAALHELSTAKASDNNLEYSNNPPQPSEPDTDDPYVPIKQQDNHNEDEHSDTDSVLAQLEAELDPSPTKATHPNLSTSPTTASLIAARKAELQSQTQDQTQIQAPRPSGHAVPPTRRAGLQTAASEESLIRTTADAAAAVVVFYSSAFATSVTMKENLSQLASAYVAHQSAGSRRSGAGDDDDASQTVFFAAEAEKCEWLCRRLKIKVLPVVVGYVEGKEVGRVVGFDGLRGGEKAGWKALAWVIGSWATAWNGTFAARKGSGSAGVLGKDWEIWVGDGGGGTGRGDDSGAEYDSENERDRRRAAGWVGGGGGNGRFKVGARSRRGNADAEDDWD